MPDQTKRAAAYPIDPRFLARWSPRAFTGEQVPLAELMTMLEAARWAPSSYNIQPWRFIYALRGTVAWGQLLDLLLPFNQLWAKQAGALVFVVSDSRIADPSGDRSMVSHSHSFDAGAAWANFGLQAQALGWHTHAMLGIDMERARSELKVPENFRVEAAIAVGRKAEKSVLSEKLQAREHPSDRKPLLTLAFEGTFRGT